jgi:hypothetical protein
MAKVWLYPDREWKEFGAEQFEVTTDVVLPEAIGKDDIDIDRDVKRL